MALALLTAAAYFGVPPLARHLLVSKLGEALHRPVAVREIGFNPLRLSVTITGFSIGERDGNGEFFSFEELFADLEAVSIFHRAPVLREVRLRNPRLHLALARDGRSYNFSDLPGRPAETAGGPKTQARTEPARFALHNIRVSGGRIEFEDRPRGARHVVADLDLTIPFVSNFPARIDTFEQPALSAVVNGAPFRLTGQTKPFKQTVETVVEISLDNVDLPRYLAYLPANLDFTVREGTLGTTLSISFSNQPGGRALLLRGAARVDRLAIADSAGAPLLSLASLQLPAFSLDVFRRRLEIENILLTGPEAMVALREKGGLNWAGAFGSKGSAAAPAAEPSPPWQVAVREVQLTGGRAHWRDDAVPGGFTAELEGIEAALRSFAFPQREPAQVELKFRTGFGESLSHRGSLLISPLLWEGAVEIAGVRPRSWETYYRRSLEYEIRDGVLGAGAHISYRDRGGGAAFGVNGLAARLESLKVRHRGARADFLSLAAAELAGCDLDLKARRLSIGSLALRKASLGLVREADGRVLPGMPEVPAAGAGVETPVPAAHGPPTPPAAAQPPPPPPVSPAASKEQPWLVEAAALRLDGWDVTLVDTTLPDWLSHTVAPLSLELTGLSTKKGSRAAFRLAAGINGSGKLSAHGDVVQDPFAARVDLDLENFALVPWYPYYADRVNFVASGGALSAKGSLAVAPGADGSPGVSFRGEAAVTNFASVDRLNAEELLTWKTLSLGGIALVSSPFSLEVGEVSLSDFYSRLIIFPDGRLNLQKAFSGEGPTVAAEGPEPAPGLGPAPPAAPPVEPPPAPATTITTTAAPAAVAPVTIPRVTLQDGTVSFSDRFIRPNYSAQLTDVAGSVSGLSSQAGTAADLEISARLDHTAPVSILGKINPLAGNLYLDVKAGVRDIELGTFTPYSGKYIGYTIEKGKMNFDVSYRIENRKLTAANRLVLDQLTFGPKVQSPQATSLPVQLAVALLKDRHGVIDLNLPISGSLDDPKFKIGRIILQVLVNLVTKAVTSPFALIGSLFGGGAELSFAPCETGSGALTTAGRAAVETLRKALLERPGLRLEIGGRADPAADREQLRRQRFELLLKAQKLKATVRKGEAAPALEAVVIDPAEYEKYLLRAYKDAKFPRQRTFAGTLKELPVAETERLLLENTVVSNDDLIDLANRRAQSAKDVLTGAGGVAPERIFLLAPVVADGEPGGTRPSARVEFSLK